MRRCHRRSVVVALALVGALATSHAAASTPDGTGGGDTRIIETMQGPVEIPASPQRVVALDEYAGMNLLTFGLVPEVVLAAFGSAVGQQVLAEAGSEIRETAAFGVPNLEALAADEPDLIVYSTEGGYLDIYDDLTAIAPTVELPYSVPWRDAITAAGDVVGEPDEAARLIGVLEGVIAERAEASAADQLSISILGDTMGMMFSAAMTSPLASVVDEAGFTRPEAELTGVPDPTFDSAVMMTQETMAEHDADVIALLSGVYYEERTFLDSPTFQALPAAQDGRVLVVDGDLWFGTYPFAIYWLLTDLAAIQAGDGQDGIGTIDDVDARWADFETLIGAS